jgi:chromosome partitioning protein
MPVVAVINRKGGSGKSTLATHLAGHCAANGHLTMLGDVDRQQSSLGWLRRRAAQSGAAAISGWAADGRSVMRPPTGVTHVVLDTPGGLRDSELARVVMFADAILMPVCNSAFDRESAAACFAELKTLPRVASGRCRVACVGMRLDARTDAVEQIQSWAAQQGIACVGALRETQNYVRCAEHGLTLFDMPAADVEADLLEWQTILEWVSAAWADAARQAKTQFSVRTPLSSRPVARPASPSAMARHSSVSTPSIPQASRLPPQGPAHSPPGSRLGWLFSVFKPAD